MNWYTVNMLIQLVAHAPRHIQNKKTFYQHIYSRNFFKNLSLKYDTYYTYNITRKIANKRNPNVIWVYIISLYNTQI